MKEEIKRNLLIVNSRDRKLGTSEDFIYSLEDNSLEIEAVSLKSASIPHSYTNVNATNNVLKYSKGSEMVVVIEHEGDLQINSILTPYILHAGIYTQNEFLDNLNTQLNGVLQVSYNSGLGRYEVTTLNNFDIPFVLSSYQYNVSYPNLWTALGFNVPLTMSSSPGSTYTAPNPPSPPFNVVPVEYFEEPIPVGQYTITELLPLVVTALSLNISGGISANISTTPPTTGKVIINGATNTWRFEECDLAHFLGFNPKEMTYQLNQTAGHLPDLLGNRYLYIASNTLANGYNCLQKAGQKTSILGVVPICSTYGSKDTWESKYPVIKKYDGSINISEVDIQILDENNKPIPLDNSDVILVFEVWCTIRL
jgi:hypothetical protein